MLVLDPKNRISIPEILSHHWMSNSDELLFEDDMIDIKKGLTRQSSMNFSGLEDSTSGEADINQVNIDNLFQSDRYSAKLSYTDYCSIT